MSFSLGTQAQSERPEKGMAGCTEPIRREIINEVRHKYQSVIHHTLYLRFPDGPSPTRPIGLAGCAGAPMGGAALDCGRTRSLLYNVLEEIRIA